MTLVSQGPGSAECQAVANPHSLGLNNTQLHGGRKKYTFSTNMWSADLEYDTRPMYTLTQGVDPWMGSRQFCRGRGRGRGREVEAEARQGSNVLNRDEARQRQRARGEAD